MNKRQRQKRHKIIFKRLMEKMRLSFLRENLKLVGQTVPLHEMAHIYRQVLIPADFVEMKLEFEQKGLDHAAERCDL